MARVPYCMLKLAPKHAYKATAVYMLFICGLTQLLIFMIKYTDQHPISPKELSDFYHKHDCYDDLPNIE
ncbi:hypothetical protein AZH43_09700 [Acinetobacter pragensis]|uniref:Uncharacterized protein n=1 Tax=Acinetobacter pragensis TaxID=1806892 RepID=A0A151Y322_9GAMM|nr:hypothetical protein AZH43_09700 [Acinetobacter pragensis]